MCFSSQIFQKGSKTLKSYCPSFRLTSSPGGATTFLFQRLHTFIDTKQVQHSFRAKLQAIIHPTGSPAAVPPLKKNKKHHISFLCSIICLYKILSAHNLQTHTHHLQSTHTHTFWPYLSYDT